MGSTTATSNLLRSVAYSRPLKDDGYPFAIETISTLSKIEFESSVTFFAGGNGTGKSTLLEAIAIGTERVPVSPSGYGTLPPGIRRLARSLTFTRAALTNGGKKCWTKYFRQGFFLRAEDFLDYKRGLVREIAELRRASDEFDDQFEGYSLQLARDATAGQADKLALRYGEDLDAMSHGESFLQFFRARFTGPGLYLLDEPDTALSPQSVLGLMAALAEMAATGAQFIIATHNPILLSFPGAAIYSFDRAPVVRMDWEDLEQVSLMRDFLTQPGLYLRHLGLADIGPS